MAEQIDSLMVKLGLDSDEKQFKQAEGQFDSLRRTALQAGAAIGAGFGLNELTFGFANATDEMARFAEVYGVAPQFVNELGFAFQQTGGDAQDAFSSIQNVADLIESTEWGEVPADAFREFGVDPMLLQGVESVADAYDRIMSATDNLDPETARRFFGAMGFSEADLRLAQGTGDESFDALMEEGRKRSELTESMLESARAFTRGQGQLTESMEGVANEISDLFAGDLGESMSEMADFLDENRDAITEFADEALPYITAMAAGIATLVAFETGKKGLDMGGGIGSILKAAGIGGLLSTWDWKAGDFEDTFGFRPPDWLFEPIGSGSDSEDGIPDGRGRNTPGAPADSSYMDSPNYDPNLDPGPLEGVAPDQAMIRGGNQTNIELNVDARGSRDPAATEAAVSRGVDKALARAAENAMIDMSSRVG